MPVVPFIPMIVSGVSGYLASRSAQKAAQAQSPQEAQATAGATAAADQLGTSGQSLISGGQQTLAGPTNYFQKLLSGNRALASQAVAAPRAAITDTYTGAARGLEQSGVRGAARDVATGELQREKAGKISSLLTGVQPAAAGALTDIGTTTTSQGAGMAQGAGGIFSGLLGLAQQKQGMALQAGNQAGSQWGALTAQLLNAATKKRASGGGGTPAWSPSAWTTGAWTGPTAAGDFGGDTASAS